VRLFEIAAIVASAVNLALAVFVFRQGSRSQLHRAYALWGVGVALWNGSAFFCYRNISPEAALLAVKVVQLGIIIAPVGVFQLAYIVCQEKLPTWFIRVIYLLHGLFVLSLFTPWFVSGVRATPYGYWAVPGPLFWFYMLSYCTLTVTPMVKLYVAQKKSEWMQRVRLRSLLAGIVLLWIAGSNDLLPILGTDRYPFIDVPFYPLGSLAAVIYVTIVGYSALQHQLLDVQVALGRIAAHFVRLGFVLLIGVCLLLVMWAVAPTPFSQYAFFSALLVLAVTTAIASVFFPRLFGSGAEQLERRILGDRFEYHDRMRDFIASMHWYHDTGKLLGDLDILLVKAIGVRSYEIILMDETSHVFTLFRSFPARPLSELPELHHDSPVFKVCRQQDSEYLAINPAYSAPGLEGLEKDAIAQLKQFDAHLCFPFFFEEEPFGLLVVGGKANKAPYTATDLALMTSLAKNLSVMINQIRLKNQIIHAQELELLGRMSRGMAHDLNNLLTPVWTLLQLASEGASTDPLNDELLPVALRNITTMRAYIREALFYSENLRPDFQLGRLDVLIANAVATVKGKLERTQVNIAVDTPGEVLVEMDEVLIQRTISNILSNAIDASPPLSTIRVELVRLIKTEANREWLRVRIIDNGSGIKPENLNRIFTPYFTTKDRGDKDRGFGLGLAICRKIVHLHGGSLNVASQLKKGTTVQIDLPSRQNRPASVVASAERHS
jgi:signal transduction histidine kinase